MSVWSTKVELDAWQEDEVPTRRTAAVWLSTATSWNECLRLDVAEDARVGPAGGTYHETVASAMLDRDMARALAARLQEFADTGTLRWSRSVPGVPEPEQKDAT